MPKAASKKAIFTDKKTVDGFVNIISKLGLGAENQMSAGHYSAGPFLSRNRQELEYAYRSSWTIGKAVDIIAEDMFKKGAEINSVMKPEDIKLFNRQMKRLHVWSSLTSAMKWARLFGGGLAVMLIDGQRPEMPLRVESIKKGQFKGFMVLDRWLVQPSLEDLITEFGIDMGAPKYYSVIGDAAALPNMKIHHSRVVRFDGIELNYYQKKAENGWGISIAERMHDRLIAFDSAILGAAQTMFKAHLRGVGVKGLREALSIGGKAEQAVLKMFEHIRRMQSNEGLTLLDADDQFWTQQYTFAGWSDMIMTLGQQIAGSTGIPLVRLFGMSPAGLNSTGESDLRTYYDTVNGLQETYLAPALAEQVFPVLHMSVFEKPLPEDFDFTFPPLWQLQDKEKVEIAKTVSAAVLEQYNAGVISQKLSLQELKQSSKVTGMWSNITDDMIEGADEEVKDPSEMFGALPGFQGKDPGKEDETKPEKPLKTQDADWDEAEHPRAEEDKTTDSFLSRIWAKVKRA